MFIRTLRPSENWRILRKECQNKLTDKKCMPGTLPWPEKKTAKEEKQKISKGIQTKPYKGWGGSESMQRPSRKRPWRIVIGLKCMFNVHSPIFQGQPIGKKIRMITFIVWVLGRVEKNAEKRVKKKMYKILFLFWTNIIVWHMFLSAFFKSFSKL